MVESDGKKRPGALPECIEMMKTEPDFTTEIIRRSGVDVGLCWHCKTCSGGCPFAESMDYHPNQIIRLVQIGMKEAALSSSSIWICVGCHTCSTACPQAIDMAAVMDALRQTAIREGVAIAEPHIHDFHKEVVNSIHRYGRTHKLEIMLRYNLARRSPFADFNLGLRMLQKRKLDLLPSKVRRVSDIRKLFQKGKDASHAGK
jgi:heterodisulfide reductase subunit C2